jgi:conjugative transposon TraM protein
MKERLKQLMSNKRGQYVIAGVIVLIGVILFNLIQGSAPATKEVDLTLDKSSGVPLPSIDSSQLSKSRMDLQQEGLQDEKQTALEKDFDFSSWKNPEAAKQENQLNPDNTNGVVGKIKPSYPSYTPSPDLSYNSAPNEQSQKELEQVKAEEKRKLLFALLELKKASTQTAGEKKSSTPDKDYVEVQKPSKDQKSPLINLISNENSSEVNSFNGLQSQEKQRKIDESFAKEFANIRAVIHSQTTILNGGRLQIRTLEPVMIKDKLIPKGTIMYGIANFASQRVKLSITSMVVDGLIVPVRLAAYDMDGMEGLFVENIIALDAIKQGSNQAIQGINLPIAGAVSSVGTAIGLSALSASTQGVKGYASKKITQQKATLKSNYYMFLKNVTQ